jgi:hypothetical protein
MQKIEIYYDLSSSNKILINLEQRKIKKTNHKVENEKAPT